jgi:hypothetical protein
MDHTHTTGMVYIYTPDLVYMHSHNGLYALSFHVFFVHVFHMCNCCPFFSKSALLFTDPSNNENANVARNAAQGGEDVAGHHNGGLFNEDPQSIHVMNEILNIFAGLTDINDATQNVLLTPR